MTHFKKIMKSLQFCDKCTVFSLSKRILLKLSFCPTIFFFLSSLSLSLSLHPSILVQIFDSVLASSLQSSSKFKTVTFFQISQSEFFQCFHFLVDWRKHFFNCLVLKQRMCRNARSIFPRSDSPEDMTIWPEHLKESARFKSLCPSL